MTASESPEPIETLLERFRAGDRRALARLITRLENDASFDRPLQGLAQGTSALRVGLTGPGGAGKSTLVNHLIKHIRTKGETVAVLACDPSSPFSGGALLGDRVRTDFDPMDDGVFFRSLSSRGAMGGLSDSVGAVLQLLEAFGFDVILVETVGAGQDQLAVRDLVNVLVLVLTPAAGDEVQFEKAGLLEVADVVVLNKADVPGADAAYANLRSMLELAPAESRGRGIPIVKTMAVKGTGVAELWDAVVAAASHSDGRRVLAERRLLQALLGYTARQFHAYATEHTRFHEWRDAVAAGQLDPQTAAAELFQALQETVR